MRKFVSNIIFRTIIIIDTSFKAVFNKSIKELVYELIRESSYTDIRFNSEKLIFFTPSFISHWRARTFYSKERETIKWIDDFIIEKNDIFWDIGANVGNYSIYAAKRHTSLSVVSFEPSFLNLNLLSRNININKLENVISIIQLPLSNKETHLQFFNETSVTEGSAINYFSNMGENLTNKVQTKTQILGTSGDELVVNKLLECPKYIKIDVDNLENEILEGIEKVVLKNNSLKSILIELNEFDKKIFSKCVKILNDNGFSIREKSRSYEPQDKKLFGTYNFIFDRI